jgi:DNA-binding IclR family transcriptional regulator
MITLAEPLEADALRLRSEFLVVPAVGMTAFQAARLVGLRVSHAESILETLVVEGFLIRMPDGSYRIRSTSES